MQVRIKCLLVDDREENLLALSALLRRDDLDILTAHSGPEALEILLKHDIALALLDVQMPEMDGFQLAELMRGSERTRNVPIIFVTAAARDQHRVFKGYESGAVDFLYKPIEQHILKNKADVFFQLDRQRQQLARDLGERTETLRLNEMFCAVLGHDLRSPLAAIVTSAHVLARQADGEAVRETAARIVGSGKRMSRMIDDMLDLARARLGQGFSVKREQQDLLPLIAAVVHEQQTGSASRRIQLKHRGDFNGDWDADRIAQAASNLIGNAVKHGEGDVIDVELDGTRADSVCLSVGNKGSIPPDVLPNIFDPFRSGERSGGDGLGLGLYIVQQIVQAHGGSVDVQSQGDRTVFSIRLPRHVASRRPQPKHEHADPLHQS